MTRLIVVLGCVLSAPNVASQPVITLGMAGAGLAAGDPTFGTVNPATISGATVVHVGMTRPYGLRDLDMGSIRVAGRGLAIGIDAMSFPGYRETTFAGQVARRLGPRWQLGLRGSLHSARPEGYEGATRMGAEFGARADVGLLDAALLLTTRFIGVGGGLTVSDWLVVLDLIRERHGFRTRAGWVMPLSGGLIVRAGFATNPVLVAVGMSLRLGSTGLALSLTRHDPLGWTAAVGASWSL